VNQSTGYSWHFDKRIPITLIAVILAQTAGIVWWGSNITTRVQNIEKEQANQAAILQGVRGAQEQRGERIAALEAGQSAILATLQRIDNKLDVWVRKP
jgi:hypothetical protein